MKKIQSKLSISPFQSKHALYNFFFYPLILIDSFFLCSFWAGCKRIDAVADEIKYLREKTIFSLDEAITSIQNAPSDWQYVLENLEKEFVHDIQATIRNDVQQLLNNSIGAATTNVVCILDAIPTRIIRTLENIKVKFLGGDPPKVTPTICQTTMNVIDLSALADTRKEIVFFGYDMVEKTSFEAILMGQNGNSMNLVNSIYFQSNYQFTIDISGLSDNLLASYNYIAVLFDEVEISAISIQKDNSTPEIQTIKIVPTKFSYTPPHKGGDADYNGHGPDINIGVRFFYTDKQVYLYVWMSARETQSDWTDVYGWSGQHIVYNAPIGWHIKGIEGPINFDNIIDITDNGHDDHIINKTLGQFTIVGDTSGDEAGTETSVDINFSYPIPILIEKD